MSEGSVKQWERADEEVRKNLPPGVKLMRTLRGHTGTIGRIAWSPDGRMLASPSADRIIWLSDAETCECLQPNRALKPFTIGCNVLQIKESIVSVYPLMSIDAMFRQSRAAWKHAHVCALFVAGCMRSNCANRSVFRNRAVKAPTQATALTTTHNQAVGYNCSIIEKDKTK